jgi:hypothetical protein
MFRTGKRKEEQNSSQLMFWQYAQEVKNCNVILACRDETNVSILSLLHQPRYRMTSLDFVCECEGVVFGMLTQPLLQDKESLLQSPIYYIVRGANLSYVRYASF